jgi:hypothetical protein
VDLDENTNSADAEDRTGQHSRKLGYMPPIQFLAPKQTQSNLWLLANIVTFRAQRQRDLTLQDFHEVLKRTKWKLYQSTKKHALVGH